MKIYTKKGDLGKTAFYDGQKVPKDHIRIEAYGTIDELNAIVGFLLVLILEEDLKNFIMDIQSDLFTIGSLLAANNNSNLNIPELNTERIKDLEKAMDGMDQKLSPLKNFILPGGNERITRAHLCRTICRRAERRVVSLSLQEHVNPIIIQYLNRLSDYFFILARFLGNIDQIGDHIWKP